MNKKRLIEHAFEELAQSLRVLLEANYRANTGGLILIDRAEAVGNIETAVTSVLNAFHSLYDAIDKQLGQNPINWHKTGELAIILAIRNARHHNKANRIRSLYTYHTQEAKAVNHIELYVLVDFPSLEDGGTTFDVYISWADLSALLSLPKNESRIAPETVKVIEEYINSTEFSGYANSYDLSESSVVINLIPLIVNAAATIVPLIKSHCLGESTESKTFRDHFCNVLKSDTKKHVVNCSQFMLSK
jgi:hypothetical protein